MTTHDGALRRPRPGVLLVDDETANLKALAALLEDDYRVFTATNASAALSMLADPVIARHVQVVVSDQRMPGMTGVQLLARIRALRPDIKGLLLTGYSDLDAIIDAINEAGVWRYMQKPVEIPELKLALTRAAEAWQLEQDNRELLAALSRSYEKLAMLDAAKISFLRYLCHEVNTPLNWLAASSVIDQHELGDGAREMLGYVDAGRKRLYGLMTAVVRYFEAAGLELRPAVEDVDVSALAETVVTHVRMTHSADFRIRVEAADALSAIETDPRLLNELLTHLVENAITHAVRGAGSKQSAEVLVRICDRDGCLVIDVHNSGRTPDGSTLEGLFQPFFFCGSMHGEDGFGLSLATARALALGLGGTLDASLATVTGNGLCLRLRLPRRLPLGCTRSDTVDAQRSAP